MPNQKRLARIVECPDTSCEPALAEHPVATEVLNWDRSRTAHRLGDPGIGSQIVEPYHIPAPDRPGSPDAAPLDCRTRDKRPPARIGEQSEFLAVHHDGLDEESVFIVDDRHGGRRRYFMGPDRQGNPKECARTRNNQGDKC
jgi:hypothetical protein